MAHARFGAPGQVLAAALEALEARGVTIERSSRIAISAPLGPSRRHYANSAAVAATPLWPVDFLALLKRVEAEFGRRLGGLRWSRRVLDIDLILWSGGCWGDAALTVPHPAFRARRFVLDPATKIAPAWRDPVTRLTVRQLRARLARPRPTPPGRDA